MEYQHTPSQKGEKVKDSVGRQNLKKHKRTKKKKNPEHSHTELRSDRIRHFQRGITVSMLRMFSTKVLHCETVKKKKSTVYKSKYRTVKFLGWQNN